MESLDEISQKQECLNDLVKKLQKFQPSFSEPSPTVAGTRKSSSKKTENESPAPPDWGKLFEAISSITSAVDILNKTVASLTQNFQCCMDKIDELNQSVFENKKEINRLTKENRHLEENVDILEQQHRNDCAIISGNAVKLDHFESYPSLLNKAKEALASNNMTLDTTNVISCSKYGKDNNRILVRFHDRRSFFRSLHQAGDTRIRSARSVFINDYLTPKRAELFYHLRQVKSSVAVMNPTPFFAPYTRGGNLFARIAKDGDPVRITSLEDIQDLKKVLRINVSPRN